MRFYLDNDVDAGCRRALWGEGHDCWTAAEAGLSDTNDDLQAVYAEDHQAIIITHDREFTNRQKSNTVGKHVRLCCDHPDGPEVLVRWLPLILQPLEAMNEVVIDLRQDSYTITAGQWR